MKSNWQNYIDGDWVDGGAGWIDFITPGMGEKLAEQALADAAVQARKAADVGAFVDRTPGVGRL